MQIVQNYEGLWKGVKSLKDFMEGELIRIFNMAAKAKT